MLSLTPNTNPRERHFVGRSAVDVGGQIRQAGTVGDRDEDGGVVDGVQPFEEGIDGSPRLRLPRPIGVAHADTAEANTSEANTSSSADECATAPNTPPCIFTIDSAAR